MTGLLIGAMQTRRKRENSIVQDPTTMSTIKKSGEAGKAKAETSQWIMLSPSE